MDLKIDYSEKRRDERGFLVDFLKLLEVPKEDEKLGQIYFVTFEKKGAIRGEHFHKNKKEWFVAVKGRLRAIFRDLETGEKREMIINGDNNRYRRIRIGENIWHSFTSLSDEAAMINYSSKAYLKGKEDTYEDAKKK